jgi:(p)ppGpp synthase/HD superfamily hydrolase
MLEKAIKIAVDAHQGQFDKGGNPYILPPLRVMLYVNEQARVAAVLHDVIEDIELTIDDLRKQGIDEASLEAITSLTKQEGEHSKDEGGYTKFVERVMKNPIARETKKADIQDNMNIDRIPNPTEKDYARVEKYKRALEKLMS